ncbi:MAG: gamma-glutamylputrescine oxidase, partial [Gaiellaceae bacterium]|nr:gamma-glutamylputrescine oxidase [Gaiellaceae bacterium]
MGNPYWLEDDAPKRPEPRHEGRVDVAIVGAGVTGCSAALRLAEAGLRVRVHDQRGVAEGASGRNGGFALRGGATRYDVARETYGVDRARGLWEWTERALDRMEPLAGDSLARVGSLRLAADAEEREDIRLEYEALRADGIAPDTEGARRIPALSPEAVSRSVLLRLAQLPPGATALARA